MRREAAVDVHPRRRIDDLRRNKRMRKGMYVLPSLFTAGNIAAGYFAVVQSMLAASGDVRRFDYAAIAIGVAAVLDFFDGAIARLTNSASEFGKQLDSLADVVTFGLAPAVLAYFWGMKFTSAPWGDPELHNKLVRLGAVVSFLFLMAAASRLARFNIQTDPKPSNPGRPGRKYFVGMPTPAGAGVIASIVHFSEGEPVRVWWFSLIWICLVFACGFLEVSTWRFYSFKNVDFRRAKPFTTVILLAAMLALIILFSRYALFIISITYMLLGVLTRLAFALRRRPMVAAEGEPQQI